MTATPCPSAAIPFICKSHARDQPMSSTTGRTVRVGKSCEPSAWKQKAQCLWDLRRNRQPAQGRQRYFRRLTIPRGRYPILTRGNNNSETGHDLDGHCWTVYVHEMREEE